MLSPSSSPPNVSLGLFRWLFSFAPELSCCSEESTSSFPALKPGGVGGVGWYFLPLHRSVCFLSGSVTFPSRFLFLRLFLFGPLLPAFLFFCRPSFDPLRFRASLLRLPRLPSATADRLRLFQASSILRRRCSWVPFLHLLVRWSVSSFVFWRSFCCIPFFFSRSLPPFSPPLFSGVFTMQHDPDACDGVSGEAGVSSSIFWGYKRGHERRLS